MSKFQLFVAYISKLFGTSGLKDYVGLTSLLRPVIDSCCDSSWDVFIAVLIQELTVTSFAITLYG